MTTVHAYEIDSNRFDYREDDVIASIVKFEGLEEIVVLGCTAPLDDLPESVLFETNIELLADAPDFPNNDVDWPIMSKRMLDVLLSVDDFAHRAISVTLLDDTVLERDHYEVLPGDLVGEFFAVQLLEYTDAIDRERSVYTEDPDFPGWLDSIEQLVLKAPAGLPPLFRLEGCRTPLWISESARQALEAANIVMPVMTSIAEFSCS